MDQPGPATRPHGARDDTWTEPATGALIDAWGDRFLQHNRGILRQKDWKEIADAVNDACRQANGDQSHPSLNSRPVTDVRCKNRVDTLKRKYKLERSKLPSPSSWPFYQRLDYLVGSGPPDAASGRKRPKSPTAAIDDADRDDEENDDDDDGGGGGGNDDDEDRGGGASGGDACRELARAVARLAEIYERTERSRLRTTVELERQRMEFSKEIEVQRLNMIMDAQLEMAKSKRPKRPGKK